MMASTRQVWMRYISVCLIANICSQSTKAEFSCETDKVQFLCPGIADKCIPKRWECDGEDDCGDNSDEEHCSTDVQCDPTEKFLCKDLTCIPKQWTCDITHDCKDGSDETNLMCANKICLLNEFTCTKSKNCIPAKWKCDFDDDCVDGSDEINCTPKPCRDTEFQCSNNKCIDKDWKCDYDYDCDDTSDEQDCENVPCSESEFQCNSSNKCIPKSHVCNNDIDCHDGSDESNCKLNTTCKEDKFDCKDGNCIVKHWICDGDVDCNTGEDEKHCLCHGEQINCGNGTCINRSKKCDGKEDCNDGSDERDCAHKIEKQCVGQQFECDVSKCIDDVKVCDNHTDCDDKSDESYKCKTDLIYINECENDNGGCEHRCFNLKFGRRCMCNHGFELKDDEKSCRDINECDELGTCSQICINKKGSYKCSCVAGYLSDGKGLRSCKAIERNPYLVFSDRYSIRKLTLQKSEFLGIVPNLPGSIALDYDLKESRMYWTDVHSATIQRTQLSNAVTGNVKVEIIVTGVRTPDGIAVDWVARKLYWTDAWYKRIEVSELDGRNRLVLIDTDIDMPRAVVLYPAIGEIFWTDWGMKPKIERCGMDGDPSSRKAIITKDIVWPNALTVDYTIDHLWWADVKRHVIEHCDLNGENRKVILTWEHVYHPFSISVFEDNVYWTDRLTTSIWKVNKFTGKNFTRLKRNLLDPMGIRVIHPQRQPAAFNFCQGFNGGCSHLCLLSAKKDKTKLYSCLCPDNIKLLSDGRTCNVSDSLICKKHMCNNGICHPGNNLRGPICVCYRGYSGLRCEYQILDVHSKETPRNNEEAVTIGIAVGVVALIFMTGAIVGIVVYKKIQKRYNPNSLTFDNPVYTSTTESIESGGSLIPFRFRKSPQPPFSKDPEPVDL